MTDNNPLDGRRKAAEEEYFRRENQEKLDKLREQGDGTTPEGDQPAGGDKPATPTPAPADPAGGNAAPAADKPADVKPAAPQAAPPVAAPPQKSEIDWRGRTFLIIGLAIIVAAALIVAFG